MKLLGPRTYPCNHSHVRVGDSVVGTRTCSTCKRTWTFRVVRSEHASKLTGDEVYKLVWSEG